MEAAHDVAPHVGNLKHLGQTLQVAGDEVQEGQACSEVREERVTGSMLCACWGQEHAAHAAPPATAESDPAPSTPSARARVSGLRRCGVAGRRKRQGVLTLVVLGLLVGELDDLVVALAQRLNAQAVPCVLVVQLLRAQEPHRRGGQPPAICARRSMRETGPVDRGCGGMQSCRVGSAGAGRCFCANATSLISCLHRQLSKQGRDARTHARRPTPHPRPLPHLRRLQRHLDVAALHCKVKPDALVAHEMQRHLRVSLLLRQGQEGRRAPVGAVPRRRVKQNRWGARPRSCRAAGNASAGCVGCTEAWAINITAQASSNTREARKTQLFKAYPAGAALACR